MNYIDVKVTLWNRIHFDDTAYMQGMAALIEESGLQEVIDPALGCSEAEILLDDIIVLRPAENEHESTIKVYTSGQLIWQNGE